MTRRRVMSLGIIIFCAIILAVVWWLYQPSFDPFILPPEMNIDIVHAAPGIADEGCGACHATALAATDDVCKSCHPVNSRPSLTFVGPSSSSTFNMPHHDIPSTIVDGPGCVGTGCHEEMAIDARYALSPTTSRDYCHNTDCHTGMKHSTP